MKKKNWKSNYLQKKIIEKLNFDVAYPSCKQGSWIECDKEYHCEKCQYNNDKQKHQIDMKVFRQDKTLSTILAYANKKIIDIYFSMVK